VGPKGSSVEDQHAVTLRGERKCHERDRRIADRSGGGHPSTAPISKTADEQPEEHA